MKKEYVVTVNPFGRGDIDYFRNLLKSNSIKNIKMER
jgi:hypothetical protein